MEKLNKFIVEAMAYGVFLGFFFLLALTSILYDKNRQLRASIDSEKEVSRLLLSQVNQYDAALGVCKEFNVLQRAMDKVSQQAYDRQDNNCYDHSKALTQALAKEGIRSSIFVNDARSHAWVGVWVEATTGRFVSTSSTQSVLEVRDGLNPNTVQCHD